MMNTAFQSKGLDASYYAKTVKDGRLESTVDELRAEAVSGFNVTIPFKTTIVPLLDETTQVASRIGAVNTVKRKMPDVEDDAGTRRYVGFNTDVDGITAPLRLRRLKVRRSIVIGSGGAARAFCQAMAGIGCESVTAVVRSVDKSRGFVSQMQSAFPEMSVESKSFRDIDRANFASDHRSVDLLFNATPVGSPGAVFPGDLKSLVKGGMTVFDAVYRPIRTPLLAEAERKGCHAIRGYEMLLHQAAAAFEIWTGLRAPTDLMEKSLFSALESEAVN
jgi:shikimate dehydrogenase